MCDPLGTDGLDFATFKCNCQIPSVPRKADSENHLNALIHSCSIKISRKVEP